MNDINVNINKLNDEMSYEPLWNIDKHIFLSLIHASHFSDKQLLEIARLYIKYNHILYRSEIQKCFDYLIIKAQCTNINNLYIVTKKLYNHRVTNNKH